MQDTDYKLMVFKFVTLFLSIYKVDEIEFIEFENGIITGKIVWYDSDEDDCDIFFSWKVDLNLFQLSNLVELLNYIIRNDLYYSDIIKVSEDKIISVFINKGWHEDVIKKTIDDLFNIEIVRIENNEIVGSFFVHL